MADKKKAPKTTGRKRKSCEVEVGAWSCSTPHVGTPVSLDSHMRGLSLLMGTVT